MKNIILRINVILLFFFVIACQSGQEKKEMKKENKCLFRSGDDLTAFYIQNPKQKETFRKVLSLQHSVLIVNVEV